MTDLFGNGQMSLFGDAPDRMPHATQPSAQADPERVRRKLYDLLARAKAAETMPWNARKAGMWQIVFPQMANWLPEEERNQLCFEFRQEMERLSRAA